MLTPYQLRRLVRGVILLISSALFTFICVLAGVNRIADKTVVFMIIAAVIGAAALVSHFGTKWVMKRIPASKTRTPQDPT